jgi:putative transposase
VIDRSHSLSIAKQAKALNISWTSVYYLPRPASAADLAIMRRMDELHLDYPFAGSRMLGDLLHAEGVEIGRLHVATLMKRMGIEAIYRKPNTSKPVPGHKIYPYLLRKTKVVRPDRVWAMDITYVPMARGFVYLAAVVDWFSRRALSHRVSITMEAYFCIEALEEAFAKHGRPEIFNTDQGSQFTSVAFTDASQVRRRHQHGRQGLPGAIMSSSSGFGDPSNTRRCISEPTNQRRRLAPRSAVTSNFTMPKDLIRALTDKPPTRPTSTGRRKSRRRNHSRHSTYKTQNAVQINPASSHSKPEGVIAAN